MEYPMQIIPEYLSGCSTVVLSRKYNIHYSSIRNFLIDNGVTLRSNKENSRRFTVKHDAFKEIDTEEKAYWLGFLSADGYVTSTTGKRVGLSISDKDIEHLEKFRKFLQSDYPIHTYKGNGYGNGTTYCRLIVSSDALYDDLVRHGVVERKSRILDYPTTVPYELQRHFLRGYIDGDGCITKNGNSYAVRIMGTDNFLDGIIQYLSDLGIYKHGRKEQRKENCPVKSLNLNGETAYGTIKHVYSDCSVALDRKFKIATDALAYFSRLYQ